MTPKRRRRKLLLRGEAENNDYLVTLLSKIDYIYYKTPTTAEQACVTAVDNFYLAYDPNDSESFNMFTASPLGSEAMGVHMDALETAVQNL